MGLYSSVINQILSTFFAFPIQVEAGTGTAKTPVVYDVPFAAAPFVVVGGKVSSNIGVYVGTNATTGHTVTDQNTGAYYYIAIGARGD